MPLDGKDEDERVAAEKIACLGMNNGEIDIAVHWFQHVIYGDAHGSPTKAVMVLNDAPG